jgi:antitoxin component of MazEF toxin-antitoxin module
MGTKKADQRQVRILAQNNTGSYSVTLPIEIVRALRWKRGQKVVVKQQGKKLILSDWE